MTTNEATARDLRRIEKRLRQDAREITEAVTRLYPPHPNSIISMDDAASFSRTPPSVEVLNSLQSAAAHLRAMHPFAGTEAANRLTTLSLLRPALMGTTVAGWVLTGQTPETRIRRAAGLALEQLAYEEGYLKNVTRIEGADAEDILAYCVEKKAGLIEWEAKTGHKHLRFKMTTAVEEVASIICAPLTYSLAAMWNELSSAAHGYGWHVQTRTYGKGSDLIEGSTFRRFSLDLNRQEYVDHLAQVTDYTNAAVLLAQWLFGDVAKIASAPDTD